VLLRREGFLGKQCRSVVIDHLLRFGGEATHRLFSVVKGFMCVFHRYVYYLLHYLFELFLEIPKNVHFSSDGDPYLLSEG
jgi:hypothetical protein